MAINYDVEYPKLQRANHELKAQLAEMQLNCDDSRNAHKTSDEWRSHWQTKAAELEGNNTNLFKQNRKQLKTICQFGGRIEELEAQLAAVREFAKEIRRRKPSANNIQRTSWRIADQLEAIIGSECDEN